MKSNLTKLAAAGVLTLSASASAMAASVTQPGETVGLALGAPLPPGFYFVDTTDWGARDTATGKTDVGVTIPVIVWSTPWKLLGARVQFLVATPGVESGTHSNVAGIADTYNAGMYNPFIGGTLAWDLGSGFGFSYTLGAYIGVNDPTAFPSSSINQRFALSYTGNGWDLTAHVIYGTFVDSSSPDFVNVDLTATKTFGKWEVGAVGFYSTDVDSVTVAGVTSTKLSQFALGALVGYDWGPLKTQAYVTRDVYEQGYGGFDTRIWGRVIVPLGDPFGAPTSTSMMYRK
jgi:hypothetical protein